MFETTYSESVIEEGARVLTRQTLRRQLSKSILFAAAVNLTAFAIYFYLFGIDTFTWFWFLVAVVLPMYWPFLFLVLPSKIRKNLRAHPSAWVTLEPESFTIAANGRATTLLWTDVKEIVEAHRCFGFGLLRASVARSK